MHIKLCGAHIFMCTKEAAACFIGSGFFEKGRVLERKIFTGDIRRGLL